MTVELQLTKEEIESISRHLTGALLETVTQQEPSTTLHMYPIIPERYITEVIDLEQIASAEMGITDIVGQIAGFFQGIANSIIGGINAFIAGVREAIIGTVRAVGNAVIDAVADYTARVIARLIDYMGPRFLELAQGVANVVIQISAAIATAVVTISAAIATSINMVATTLSAAIATLGTSLALAINQVATSLSAAIAMLGTSLSVAMLQMGHAISQSILMVSTSLSAAIAALGASLSQAILSVSTALSVAISQMATAISGAIVSLSTALSGAIVQLSTSFAVALNQVATALSTAILNVATALSTAIATLGTSLAVAITNVATALSGAITMLASSLSTAILQLGTSIISVLGGLMTTAIAGIYLIQGRVDVAIAIMQDFFPKFSEALATNLVRISAAIRESFGIISSAIIDFSTRLTDALTTNLQTFVNRMVESVEKVTNLILETSARTNETLIRNMMSAIEAIAQTGERLASALAFMHRTITDAIIASFENASRAIRENFAKFMDTLREQFTKLSDALRDAFKKAVDETIKAGEKTIDFIRQSSEKITNTLLENWQKFMDKLLEELAKLDQAIRGLTNAWMGFINAVLQLPEKFEPVLKRRVKEGVEEYWKELFEVKLPKWKIVWDEFPKFFEAKSISGFEAMIWTFIASVQPRPYGEVSIGNIAKIHAEAKEIVLGKLAQEIPAWLTSPSFLFEPLLSAFTKYVAPNLSDVWSEFTKALGGFWQTLVTAVQNFSSTLFDLVKSLAETLSQTIMTGVKALFDTIGGIGKALEDFFKTQYNKVVDEMSKLAKEMIKPQLDEMLKLIGISSPQFLQKEAVEDMLGKWGHTTLTFLLIPFWAQIPVRLAAMALHTAGNYFMNQSLPIRISLEPFGLGVDFQFDVVKAIGASLSHFSAEVKQYIDILGAAIAYGMGIWISQPITRMISFHLRNFVPIEIPQVEQMTEITRRAMALVAAKREKDFEDVLKLAKLYTMVQGYPDTVINLLYWKEGEYNITVTDRFGQSRIIPLSMMHVLPGVSDVARMIIRDIILEPDELKKMFMARGMNADIATMFYLLHFRYPPPERLWSFYTRGISGLLWVKISPNEAKDLEREAKIVKAFTPTPPEKLNFDAATLEQLLKTYMKWHDFARFSYSNGWPSDNLIVIDTLADIPTKIDQRWMVRFGLYEFMSEKGLSHTSPVSNFVSQVVEATAKGNIQLDLTNFCRTLQATGLHPHYVPITAVAETINAITDERTLLRTGVINLYKEGFFDANSVIKMLTGVIMTSFKVAFFDPATGGWNTGYINIPLRYLNMEARLIGLRAIMDRALDILRDIQRDVLTGYQEFIIETFDEFKEKFSDVIKDINSVYSADYKAITGEEPPSELSLKFVEAYYQPYLNALGIWRDVWTIRRIRMWTQRWLGWLMYRIAQGVSKKEEIRNLVEFMAKSAKLPKMEHDYILKVMEFMFELALREYIPTPMQLATIAEFVKIDAGIIQRAFEQRLVPEEWKPIWAKFIEVRPLADDVRGLLTSYRRLLVYIKKPEQVPADVQNAVKAAMELVGFTDKEMAIFDLRVRIEELLASLKEFVPTPMQMATLAEFVKLPPQLIEGAFEIRNIPSEWRGLWSQFINIRPLADDVRELIRSFLRALGLVEEAKQFADAVKSFAQKIGYGPEEMQILETRIQLEEMVLSARQYIPTPIQLATIAETLPQARTFFAEVMKRHRIPPSWQALWAQYIDIRPLVDDLKKFLSRAEQLYIRFMVKKEDFLKQIKDVVEKLGFTKTEQDILIMTTELERWRNAWTELIGSVERLVSLSEYSPRAAKFALAKVNEMIDSLPLPASDKQELKLMWEEFIRNRPVKAEAKTYITQLINAFVEGIIDQTTFENELEAMKQYGFSDTEIMFYKANAAVRKARKLKIPLVG
jgi:phage-related protein